jgi:GxxExxY protein
MLTHGDVTGRIIKCFYRVYDELGFGFFESVYGGALAMELTREELRIVREAPVDVWYKGEKIGFYRADFLVEGSVVLELKACEKVGEKDERQLLNSLRATNLEVGLLLHFGPKPGFKRLVFDNARKRALGKGATALNAD